MLGKDFRNLAEAVTSTYGNNPWFFLRELAQNSRDAGARSIWVKAERTAAGLEILTFADDGRGMTSVHARRFLFRLYASDKTKDKMSAGKYGIGFWTILSFQPSQILVQSRTIKNSWAVALNADLEVQPVTCSLIRPGTTIILTRPAVFSSAPEFSRTVENELRGYCQYLRRNDRRGTMLPVYFHEQNVTIPMSLPGPLSYSFHSGPVEGAVGLAEKPLVRLYARGLPVWEGAVLNQMSHLQPPADGQPEIDYGLAPVFLLNGNQLDVTFSRNLVLENKALEKVQKNRRKSPAAALEKFTGKRFPQKMVPARQRPIANHFQSPLATGLEIAAPGAAGHFAAGNDNFKPFISRPNHPDSEFFQPANRLCTLSRGHGQYVFFRINRAFHLLPPYPVLV